MLAIWLCRNRCSLLTEGLRNDETGEAETLQTVPTLFQAAMLIGRAVRQVRAMEQAALEQANLRFDVTFLFGGQIAGGPMELYLIYSAGNFIRCGPDAPISRLANTSTASPSWIGPFATTRTCTRP